MSHVEVAEQLLGAVETLTLAVVQFLHGPDGGWVWRLDGGPIAATYSTRGKRVARRGPSTKLGAQPDGRAQARRLRVRWSRGVRAPLLLPTEVGEIRIMVGHNRGIPVHFFLKPLEDNDLRSRRTISYGTLGNS